VTDASDNIIDYLWDRAEALAPIIAADIRATVAYVDSDKVGVLEFVGIPFNQDNLVIAPVVVDVQVLFALGLLDEAAADEAFAKLDEQIANNNTEESAK
jgi:hypothetical protein